MLYPALDLLEEEFCRNHLVLHYLVPECLVPEYLVPQYLVPCGLAQPRESVLVDFRGFVVPTKAESLSAGLACLSLVNVSL